MSDSNKPVRRRRIAGERPAAAPVAKPVVRKTPTKRSKPEAAPAAPVAKAAKVAKAPVPPKVAAPPKVRTAAKPPPVEDRPAAADAAVETVAATATPARPSRRDLLPLAVLALFAAASIIFGSIYLVDGIKDSGGKDDVVGAQTQATAAAGSAAETIFSFSYDKLDDHLATSTALMTPKFAEDFKKIAPALTDLAPQRKIVVKAAVSEAAVLPCGNSCSADKADVLVFLDQARLIGDSTTPTVFANRIKVSMVRDGGTWLVSDIRAI